MQKLWKVWRAFKELFQIFDHITKIKTGFVGTNLSKLGGQKGQNLNCIRKHFP